MFMSVMIKYTSAYHADVFISKRKARPILMELQNKQCIMCKQTFSQFIPHEVHHIDHNRNNNTLHNFALLCANCHASHHRFSTPFPHEKYKVLLENDDE